MSEGEIAAVLTAVAGVVYGIFERVKSVRAQRHEQRLEEDKARALVEKDRAKEEKSETDYILKKYKEYIAKQEQKLDALSDRLDLAQAEHHKCREALVVVNQTADWQRQEIEELKARVADLEGRK